jgi:hypothetical protein
MIDADQIKQQADDTSARREREEATLYREDGSKVYGEEEHAERLALITSRRDADIAGLVEQAERATSEAQARVENIENRDPLDRLSEDELQRAGGRRAFVKEDAEDLPLGELAKRITAATASGDKAMIALWSRYAQRRVGSEREKAQQSNQAGRSLGPDHAEGFGQLQEAVGDMEKKMNSGGRAIELKSARDKLDAATEASHHVHSRTYTHEEKMALSGSPLRNF